MDIKQLAKKYELSKEDFWELKRGSLSKWIVTHDAVEKIAYKEGIEFLKPEFIRNEKSDVACNTWLCQLKR
jgi:RecB family endonuclease NucS